jgi:hypothetical protein
MYIFHPRKIGSKGGMEREGGRGGSKTKKERMKKLNEWEDEKFTISHPKEKIKRKGGEGGRVGRRKKKRKRRG